MARTRITKAQQETKAKQAAFVDVLRSFSHQVSEIAFTFPEAKNQARDAHDALVELAEAVGRVGEPARIPTGPINRAGE